MNTPETLSALERAIRAEGYSILVDPSTGYVLLTKAAAECPACATPLLTVCCNPSCSEYLETL